MKTLQCRGLRLHTWVWLFRRRLLGDLPQRADVFGPWDVHQWSVRVPERVLRGRLLGDVSWRAELLGPRHMQCGRVQVRRRLLGHELLSQLRFELHLP